MAGDSHITIRLPAGEIRIPLSEIAFAFARSGGPGGQNVNKVETKVEARFRPRDSAVLTPEQVARIEKRLSSRITKDGDLIVVSSETRYRERNREAALARMVTLLQSALTRKKRRKPTRPTAGSRERRLSAKKRRGETKRGRGESGLT